MQETIKLLWTGAALAALFRSTPSVSVLTAHTHHAGRPARTGNTTGAIQVRHAIEQKIWSLPDDPEAADGSLPDADFRALGENFVLPDGGKAATELALAPSGGAFEFDSIRADEFGLSSRAAKRRREERNN